MIVVIGVPSLTREGTAERATGPAALAAAEAVARGAQVELVGKAGEDPEGDRLMLALAAAGIGHVALLRTSGARTPVVEHREPEPAEPLLDAAIDSGDGRAGPRPGQPRPELDSADLELALRYLRDFRVVVVAEPQPVDVVGVAADAAAYAEAHLLVVVTPGSEPPPVPEGSTVLEAPGEDPDGDFARLLGAYAAAVDGGRQAGDAFRELVAGLGWTAPEG